MGFKVYQADIRPLLAEPNYNLVYRSVSEARRKKADAMRSREAKAASLTAGFLAEYALQMEGLSGACVAYTGGGQPVIRGKKAFISLSHSGSYAVCAVADAPVGVDIQEIKPVRAGVLRHFFDGPQRQEFLKACGLTGGDTAKRQENRGISEEAITGAAAVEFLRYWAAKESYMKLTGLGMQTGFRNITADLKNNEVWDNRRPDRKERLHGLKAPDGYVLTVCGA